jgi:hypothetical protein
MNNNTPTVREMLLSGIKHSEIARTTGLAGSTISYHAKRLGLGKFCFTRTTFDWTEIQKYYDDGYSITEVVEHFKMSWTSLQQARKEGKVLMTDRHRGRKTLRLVGCMGRDAQGNQVFSLYLSPNARRLFYSDEYIFQANSTVSMPSVKKRAKALLSYSCSTKDCVLHGIEHPSWAGERLVLHLDHINGIRNDHRISNIRWLCPNCHTQTPTYCCRNKKRNRE